MPSHTGNKTHEGNSNEINKTLQGNCCLNNPSENTNAAKISSSAPSVSQRTSGPAITNGLQRRLQPHSQSIALEPTTSTFGNPLINSGAPGNPFQNAFNAPSHHLHDAITNYTPHLNLPDENFI